jgi:hypothetical protein
LTGLVEFWGGTGKRQLVLEAGQLKYVFEAVSKVK